MVLDSSEQRSSSYIQHLIMSTTIPNRFHNSGKTCKPRLKPQAKRARKAALKALKRKLLAQGGLGRVLGRTVYQ